MNALVNRSMKLVFHVVILSRMEYLDKIPLAQRVVVVDIEIFCGYILPFLKSTGVV